jgi:hypothetical protein
MKREALPRALRVPRGLGAQIGVTRGLSRICDPKEFRFRVKNYIFVPAALKSFSQRSHIN